MREGGSVSCEDKEKGRKEERKVKDGKGKWFIKSIKLKEGEIYKCTGTAMVFEVHGATWDD